MPSESYRVLITGSRHWYCRALAERVVSRIRTVRWDEPLVFVHGDAPGVDSAFRDACREIEVPDEPHPADWSLGKKGGPLRNQEMVNGGARICLAFSPDLGKSRGTADCARRALRAGIPTWLTTAEDARPIRLCLAGEVASE